MDTTTTLAKVLPQWYNKKLLELVKKRLVMTQFAQASDFPDASGTTVQMHRYLPMTLVDTYLTEGINPTPEDLLPTNFTATLHEMGGLTKTSSLADRTVIDRVRAKTDLIADQAARSLDWDIMKVVSPGALHLRADADTTYSKIATATSDGASNGTTFISTGLDEGAGDFWLGSYGTCTSLRSLNYGMTGKCASSVQYTNTYAATAFPQQFITGDVMRITVGTAVAAGDSLQFRDVVRAVQELDIRMANQKFDGYYALVTSPEVIHELTKDASDPAFVALMYYRDEIETPFNGEYGRLYGTRVVKTDQNYRESVAGAQSDSGVVHSALFLGKGGFGTMTLDGLRPAITVGEGASKADPLGRFSTLGWEIKWTCLTLNTNYMVNQMCSPNIGA